MLEFSGRKLQEKWFSYFVETIPSNLVAVCRCDGNSKRPEKNNSTEVEYSALQQLALYIQN